MTSQEVAQVKKDRKFKSVRIERSIILAFLTDGGARRSYGEAAFYFAGVIRGQGAAVLPVTACFDLWRADMTTQLPDPASRNMSADLVLTYVDPTFDALTAEQVDTDIPEVKLSL